MAKNNKSQMYNTPRPAGVPPVQRLPMALAKLYFRWQPDKQRVISRNEEQRRLVREYFIIPNFPHRNAAFLIFGLIFLIGGILAAVLMSSELMYIVIGAVVALIGIIFIIVFGKHVKYRPNRVMTDSEYEAAVMQRIKSMNIYQMGLKRLGLDQSQVTDIRPIVLKDKIINDTSLTVFNPVDHSIHSSTQNILMIFFTRTQLLAYKIEFDMCCNAQKEWTNEFYYKDITDVSTFEEHSLHTYGDIVFEYTSLNFDIVAVDSRTWISMDSDSDKLSSIQLIKQYIRERKNTSAV